MLKANPQFPKSIKMPDHFNASECLSCGQCTAICPLGIEVLPRTLFRYVLFGLEEKILENTTSIFQCLQCKMCETHCHGGVRIAENVRALRTYINRDIHRLVKS